MIVTVPQLMGVIIGLFCSYYSYIQFKKRVFGVVDFFLWIGVWGGLIILSIISGFIPLTRVIYLYSVLDLVIVLSIILLFGLIFVLYMKFKSYQLKTKKIIERIAFLDVEIDKKRGYYGKQAHDGKK